MSDTASNYAIIRAAGKQYRVAPGDKVKIDKLETPAGEAVTFSDVLLVKNGETLQTGRPTVAGASVTGEVLRQMRDKKVLVFKKRPKKGYKKLAGHRQYLTEVLIKSVQAGA
jgi:large subunit ribosomal protein L21